MAGVARSVAGSNVTINFLLPGTFDTDRLQSNIVANAKISSPYWWKSRSILTHFARNVRHTRSSYIRAIERCNNESKQDREMSHYSAIGNRSQAYTDIWR